MSQGTPTRDSRIERHLMRQRGAGVRTITADFGFSFALPTTTSTFPVQPLVEPPTKRQKTKESPSSKPCQKHILKQEEKVEAPKGHMERKSTEHDVAQAEDLPTKQCHDEKKVTSIEIPVLEEPFKNAKRPKAPSKPRRKLQLDDEFEVLPQPKTKKTPQPEGLEDTFLFELKPKQKQQNSKLKETVQEELVQKELVQKDTENAPAPPRKKRTAKTKQKANDEPCEKTAGDPSQEVASLEGNLRKGKGKPTGRKRTNAIPSDIKLLEEGSPAKIAGVDPPKVDFSENHHVETSLPQSAPKATKPKSTAKKAMKRSLDKDVENETVTVPEPTAKRPRRQAAISATVKVAMSYEEELVPADKLRRAPEPMAKRGRPRKIAAPDDVLVLPPSPPQSPAKPPAEEILGCDEDEVPVAKARPVKRTRKPSAKTTKVDVAAPQEESVAPDTRTTSKTLTLEDSHHVADTKAPISQAPAAVKGTRKVRAEELAQKDTMDESPVVRASDSGDTCEVEQERSRASKVLPLKPRRKVASKVNKPVDIIDEKTAVVNDVSGPPDIVIPETQESRDTIKKSDSLASDQTKKPCGNRMGAQKTTPRRALAESHVNIVRCPPPDDLEISIKPAPAKLDHLDEAMTKPSSKCNNTERTREKQSGQKAKRMPNADPIVEHEDRKRVTNPTPDASIGLDHTKRSRKAQPAQKPQRTSAVEAPRDEPVVPRKRHVIAADEDLDWLFEKCENKCSRLPAGNPRASSKVNRSAPIKKRADAKDMDLDDLLESIAGFSGKLSTGKSGRAMASR